MLFFATIAANLKAQNVQFSSSSSCNVRSLAAPLAVCPSLPDCHGHGNNPGSRDCFGCSPVPGGADEFPKASDYVTAKGTSIISGNISVSNNFIVDVPITFNGADIRLTDKAKITVNYNASLSSIASNYYACEGIWEGIIANGTLSLQGGVIEDARVAVQFGAYLKSASIQGVTFKRNKVGIGFKGSTVKPHYPFSFFVFKQFSGNTFDCKERLNISSPDAYRWGTAGITIQGGVLNINKGTGNTFQGKIRTGIEVIGASAVISGCDFTKIDYTIFSNCDEKFVGEDQHTILGTDLFGNGLGYGIYAEKSTLVVTSCKFRDCAGGSIRTLNTNTKINANHFYFVGTMLFNDAKADFFLTESQASLEHLIFCELPGVNPVNVSDNVFFPIWLQRQGKSCIYVDQSLKSAVVHNNNITFSNGGSSPYSSAYTKGIHIYGQSSSSKVINTFVTKNMITVSGSAVVINGILVERAKYVSVGHTDVATYGKNIIKNFQGDKIGTNYAGIYLLGSSDCKVLNNEVTGDFRGANAKATGIAYLFKGISGKSPFKAEKNIIAYNSADEIKSGFVFEGACDESKFYCNEMKACANRLMLVVTATATTVSPEPVIGVQQYGALWNQDYYRGATKLPTPYNLVDATHQGIFPVLSLFKYKTKDYPFDPQVVVIAGGKPKSDWFRYEQVRESCVVGPNLTNPDDNADISALEDAIARGLMSEEKPVFVWEYEKELYEKFRTQPALLTGHPEREAFFNTKSQTNIPAFNVIGKGIEDILALPEADLAQIATWQRLRDYQLSRYNAFVEECLILFGDNAWGEENIAVMEEELLAIAYYDNQIDTRIAALKAQQIATANELMIQNNELVTNNEYEQDAKITQKLWLFEQLHRRNTR